MLNFEIRFSYPWLLLLLIPAALLTLIPYFRLAKRYRRTRNRITSIVLHLIVMVLSIAVLSGMTFYYQVPNDENEIILLVDVSDTEEQSQLDRDELVQTLLKESKYDQYRVGIVTFGFDQEYAVPLTNDVEEIYDQYLVADLPDTSATNIAAALTYTKDLFNNPETAKIVLITDGKETDEQASTSTVIRSIAAQGTKVDVVHVPSEYEGVDVQLVGVELPDYHVNVGVECTITLTVQSKSALPATIELYDNGVVNDASDVQNVELITGLQTFSFQHTFKATGSSKESGELHELSFRLKITEDSLEQNNEYVSYLYLEVFNNVLIIERVDGESESFMQALGEDNYNMTVKSIDAEDMPTTIDELRAYDQVILNNISNSELKSVALEKIQANGDFKSFDLLLESYVSEYGGGLFTVGGNNEDGEANAYDKEDMYGSVYQRMLPVQAIEYTPPLGVIVIIDRSGSMGGSADDENSKLKWARAGATACLDALSERDYIGVMTLDSDYGWILQPTPRTQDQKIREAIASIGDTGGGTVFSDAIDRAGKALRALTNVDKRHIMIVTDGLPGDTPEDYEPFIQEYYETDGITLSIFGVGMSSNPNDSANQQMQHAVDLGHGRLIIPAQNDDLVALMREELEQPAIEEINYQDFNPIVYDPLSPLVQGLERVEDSKRDMLSFSLSGFYGVKKKEASELILVGDYEVPIYAQWKYGNGMVGSFMCDVSGRADSWSYEMLNDPNGQQFLRNVINNLMPTEDIKPHDMSMELKEDNYTNKLSVYGNLKEGETLKGVIEAPGVAENISLNEATSADVAARREMPCYVTTPLSESNHYSRCDFVVKESGVYKITIIKYNAEGVEISRLEAYKSFSYSEEYDSFVENEEISVDEQLQELANKGNGILITDLENPWAIFNGFITALDRTFDPRFLFMILAIVLFLLDIAVRKFKFKWPHELIREYKEKKNSKK